MITYNPIPNENLARLKIVVLTIALNIAAVIFFATLSWSDWRTGMVLNLLDNAILITYAIIRRDRLMGKLLIFGLAVGFTELVADAWLVDYTRTLDYSVGGGPMLWLSPLWMPFAWEIVAVQFAVLGGWLVDRFRGSGYLLTGFLGAMNIPFYEEMAKHTNWWTYTNCRMISQTPYYIIFGEFLIVLGIVWFGRKLESQNIKQTIFSGIVAGVAIFVSYALAYFIFK